MWYKGMMMMMMLMSRKEVVLKKVTFEFRIIQTKMQSSKEEICDQY